MKKMKLVIKFTRDNNETINKLSTILSNISMGRKYSKLKLVYANEAIASHVKPLLLKILALVGKSLKELEISCGNYKSLNDIALLLKCFDNVEKVVLSNVHADNNELGFDVSEGMVKLKELLMQDSKSTLLKLFERFTNLHRLKFHLSSRESENISYGVRNLENFVLQQSALKILDISRMNKNLLFHENIFDDRKFKLELIIANKFFLSEKNATNFFAKQTNLKAIKLYDFCDSRSAGYSNVLRTIFNLPSLESVGVFNGTINIEDFDNLQQVHNCSVKHLEYDMWNSTVLEKFIDMFPHLQKISFRCFTVKLRDVSCEKLSIMNTSGSYCLEEFIYQPSNITNDQRKFEEVLKSFVIRNKGIKHFTIGHNNWIENNFGLSLNFWIEALYYLIDMSELVVYNPLDIKALYMLLARNKNTLKSVTFYTSLTEKQSLGKFEETWLKIVVV